MMALSKPMLGRRAGPTPTDNTDDIAYSYRRKIGRYLRDLRLGAGLTQADVAKHLDVVPTTVSSFELGRGAPSPERYDALADLFGISRKEFGKFLLLHTNPWIFDMIYGRADRSGGIQETLKTIPERIGRRGHHSPEDRESKAGR